MCSQALRRRDALVLRSVARSRSSSPTSSPSYAELLSLGSPRTSRATSGHRDRLRPHARLGGRNAAPAHVAGPARRARRRPARDRRHRPDGAVGAPLPRAGRAPRAGDLLPGRRRRRRRREVAPARADPARARQGGARRGRGRGLRPERLRRRRAVCRPRHAGGRAVLELPAPDDPRGRGHCSTG